MHHVVLAVVSSVLLITVSVGCNDSTASSNAGGERLCPSEFEKYDAFNIECDSAIVVEDNEVRLVGYKENVHLDIELADIYNIAHSINNDQVVVGINQFDVYRLDVNKGLCLEHLVLPSNDTMTYIADIEANDDTVHISVLGDDRVVIVYTYRDGKITVMNKYEPTVFIDNTTYSYPSGELIFINNEVSIIYKTDTSTQCYLYYYNEENQYVVISIDELSLEVVPELRLGIPTSGNSNEMLQFIKLFDYKINRYIIPQYFNKKLGLRYTADCDSSDLNDISRIYK